MTVNEKIANWCEFTEFENRVRLSEIGHVFARYPDGIKRLIPDFQNDFSPCLKWAVPELRKKIYPDYLNIQFGYEPENISCVIQGNDCRETFGYGDTESQAFTDALEKLISDVVNG